MSVLSLDNLADLKVGIHFASYVNHHNDYVNHQLEDHDALGIFFPSLIFLFPINIFMILIPIGDSFRKELLLILPWQA